jgi:FixJ family two-component response regulator
VETPVLPWQHLSERHILKGQPYTVAVVEDDPSMRISIVRLLSAHGFTTEDYASAEAFLRRDPFSSPNCIVLDNQLGGMSGTELLRRLNESKFRLPAIMITANDNRAQELEAIDAGCVAYLHKPFPAHRLLEAIDKALAMP